MESIGQVNEDNCRRYIEWIHDTSQKMEYVCTSTIIICHNHLFPSHAVGSPACQRPGGGHSLHACGEMDSPLAMWMTKHWNMGGFSQYVLNSFNIDHYFPSIYPIENGYVIFWGLYFSMWKWIPNILRGSNIWVKKSMGFFFSDLMKIVCFVVAKRVSHALWVLK